MDEYCPCQAIAGPALVELLAGRPPQLGILDPLEGEQGPLAAAGADELLAQKTRNFEEIRRDLREVGAAFLEADG